MKPQPSAVVALFSCDPNTGLPKLRVVVIPRLQISDGVAEVALELDTVLGINVDAETVLGVMETVRELSVLKDADIEVDGTNVLELSMTDELTVEELRVVKELAPIEELKKEEVVGSEELTLVTKLAPVEELKIVELVSSKELTLVIKLATVEELITEEVVN